MCFFARNKAMPIFKILFLLFKQKINKKGLLAKQDFVRAPID